ncbi:MAG: hypothetical protein AAF630_03320 [Cyanobacteria bacterium P01_C01_bin.38]
MGWTDIHLHRFIIHGKQFGIPKIGGTHFSDNPDEVRLSSFGLRIPEVFYTNMTRGDSWQHQIRVEKILTPKPNCLYYSSISASIWDSSFSKVFCFLGLCHTLDFCKRGSAIL